MKKDDIFDVVPEGVEAQVLDFCFYFSTFLNQQKTNQNKVPYRGSVRDIVHQLCGGLASGISYCGAFTIPEMQEKAQFVRITVRFSCFSWCLFLFNSVSTLLGSWKARVWSPRRRAHLKNTRSQERSNFNVLLICCLLLWCCV